MKAGNKILDKEKIRPKVKLRASSPIPTPETIREMGTSFLHNDFTWDRLGGEGIVMIGRWYSRKP